MGAPSASGTRDGFHARACILARDVTLGVRACSSDDDDDDDDDDDAVDWGGRRGDRGQGWFLTWVRVLSHRPHVLRPPVSSGESHGRTDVVARDIGGCKIERHGGG